MILTRWREYNRDRRRNADFDARRRQGARAWVDAEHHDAPGILIRGQQELSAGIDGEIARRFAARRSVPGRGQRARRNVDAKDGDAVMTAIGGVQKLPAGMNLNLRGAVVSGKTGRKRMTIRRRMII